MNTRHIVSYYPTPDGFDPEEHDPIADVPEHREEFDLLAAAKERAEQIARTVDLYWGEVRVEPEIEEHDRDEDGRFSRWVRDESAPVLEYDGEDWVEL